MDEELKKILERAVASLKARVNEDIEEWARNLAKDFVDQDHEEENPNITIYINGERFVVSPSYALSYRMVVARAGYGLDRNPSVNFRKGMLPNPEGIMAPTDILIPVDGMKFNVIETGNA